MSYDQRNSIVMTICARLRYSSMSSSMCLNVRQASDHPAVFVAMVTWQRFEFYSTHRTLPWLIPDAKIQPSKDF